MNKRGYIVQPIRGLIVERTIDQQTTKSPTESVRRKSLLDYRLFG
jgi:hypothetical protein